MSGLTSTLAWRIPRFVLVILFLTLASSRSTRADGVAPCVAGALATILNTGCTIGDKTFDFGNYSLSLFGNEISANPALVFYFTPDDTNPNSPGFTLSATAGVPFATPPASSTEQGFDFSLSYVVSVTNTSSGADILGTTVSDTGAAANANSGGNAQAIASNTLNPGVFLCNDEAQAGAAIPGPLSFGSTNDSLILGCGGYTTTPGIADITVTGANGTATLTNASFFIDETAGAAVVTPEPSGLLLLGAGLIGLASLARRTRLDRIAGT